MGVKGLMKLRMRKMARRMGRAIKGSKPKVPARQRIKFDVMDRWSATDSRAELKRFIREGLEKFNVPEDRHKYLVKVIVKDVIEEKRRALEQDEAADAAELETMEKRRMNKVLRS